MIVFGEILLSQGIGAFLVAVNPLNANWIVIGFTVAPEIGAKWLSRGLGALAN